MAVNVIVDGLHTGPLCLQGEGALPVSSIRRLVEDSFDHNVSESSVFLQYVAWSVYLICLCHLPGHKECEVQTSNA